MTYSRDPRFKVTCQFEIGGKITPFVYTGPVPKELMDAFEALIGDGKAGVTVSSDVSLKKFGNGAGGMVTVSLTCGQNQTTIHNAMELAAQASRFYVQKFQTETETELRKNLQAQGRPVEF